jgi:hypothetical protein
MHRTVPPLVVWQNAPACPQKQKEAPVLDAASANTRARVLSAKYRREVQESYSALAHQMRGVIADTRTEGTDREWLRAPPVYLEEKVVLFELGGLHSGKAFSGAQLAVKARAECCRGESGQRVTAEHAV